MLQVICVGCDKKLNIPFAFCGKKIRCRFCKNIMMAPLLDVEPVPSIENSTIDYSITENIHTQSDKPKLDMAMALYLNTSRPTVFETILSIPFYILAIPFFILRNLFEEKESSCKKYVVCQVINE